MSKQLTHKGSLLKTGVTTDAFTPKGAAIMVASACLYAVVQVLLLITRSDTLSSSVPGVACPDSAHPGTMSSFIYHMALLPPIRPEYVIHVPACHGIDE